MDEDEDFQVFDLSDRRAYDVALGLVCQGYLVFVKTIREGDGADDQIGNVFIGWAMTPRPHVTTVLHQNGRIRAAYLLGAGTQMWREFKRRAQEDGWE